MTLKVSNHCLGWMGHYKKFLFFASYWSIYRCFLVIRCINTSGFCMRFLHRIAIFYYLPRLSKTKVSYKKLQRNAVNTCGNRNYKHSFRWTKSFPLLKLMEGKMYFFSSIGLDHIQNSVDDIQREMECCGARTYGEYSAKVNQFNKAIRQIFQFYMFVKLLTSYLYHL